MDQYGDGSGLTSGAGLEGWMASTWPGLARRGFSRVRVQEAHVGPWAAGGAPVKGERRGLQRRHQGLLHGRPLGDHGDVRDGSGPRRRLNSSWVGGPAGRRHPARSRAPLWRCPVYFAPPRGCRMPASVAEADDDEHPRGRPGVGRPLKGRSRGRPRGAARDPPRSSGGPASRPRRISGGGIGPRTIAPWRRPASSRRQPDRRPRAPRRAPVADDRGRDAGQHDQPVIDLVEGSR